MRHAALATLAQSQSARLLPVGAPHFASRRTGARQGMQAGAPCCKVLCNMIMIPSDALGTRNNMQP
eukprot:13081430-Alexandrium_andersonii.AAC.1